MIEAIEKHETEVTLKSPIRTGIYLGIGLILAPLVLFLLFSLFMMMVSAMFGGV